MNERRIAHSKTYLVVLQTAAGTVEDHTVQALSITESIEKLLNRHDGAQVLAARKA